MDKKIKLDIINKILTEDVSLRKANAKIYPLGKGKYHAAISLGEIHYKDNYSDNKEPWKDIDLTWNGNRIDKAPYILERDGNIYTVTDKRTGLQSVVELTDIGAEKIKKADVTDKKVETLAAGVDFEIIPQNHQIKFQRTLKNAAAAKDAQFKITGDIPIKYQAFDADGEPVELETSIADGVLTETVKEKTGLKYPIKVDPTIELPAVVASGSVTRANMKISAIDGTAFVDFSTALILTAYTGYKLVIKDSAGKELVGYIKAAGTGETLDVELYSDTGFADDGAWLKYLSGWSVAGGKGVATAAAANAVIYQTKAMTFGKLYKLVYTQDSISAGGTLPQLYTVPIEINNNTTGTFTWYVTIPVNANSNTGIRSKSGTTCTIDDITAKQVLTPSATGVTIVSEKGGSTYNWTSKDADFNYYDASGYTYEIWGGASNHDCYVYYNGSAWVLQLANTQFLMAHATAITAKRGGGLYYSGGPPQGAQIDTSYITFTSSQNDSSTTVNLRITGNKQPVPAVWSNIADYQARRGTLVGGANDDYITTAQVDWDNVAAWTKDSTYNTPELKTITQEQVNQSGYNGVLALFVDDHDGRTTMRDYTHRRAYSYDGTPAKAPVLHIEYTVVIETNACTDVTSDSATANAEIIIADNTVIRRGFVYIKGNTGSPLITDLNAIVISEETKSGIDGLVLRKYNGDLEENGYFTLDDIIDLGAVYTVRAHGILTTTSLNLYDDLYSYTDLYAAANLYGASEGKTSVVIEISTTNDDTTAEPEWSDWQTFVVGDYSARGFRFRLYAEGLPPDITPIIYSVYIELDMEDRVYSFEETVTEGGITIEFDPPFYAAPHIGISILDAQSGDYYVIDTKDENGFDVEIFNGVSSVERAISGIARGYGMKEV